MPLGDWQFWVVTAVCVAGAVVLLRVLRPRSRGRRERRVKLTIERRPPAETT